MCHPTAIIPPSIKYPRGAREKRVAGTVSVKCTLPLDGYPRNCRIVRSVPELDQEVLRAMSSARYEPATFQGRPVQVNYVFSFKFNPSVEPSIQ
jgi:protein TonB